MNIVFWILLILGLGVLWLCCSFAFKWIGGAALRLFNDAKEEMKEMNQELNQRMDMMQEDINDMKIDMKLMKQDMEQVKVDIKLIRWEQSDTTHIVKAIINELGQLNKKLKTQANDKYIS